MTRSFVLTAVCAALVSLAGAPAFAQTAAKPTKTAAKPAAKPVADTATESVNDTQLVITKAGKAAKEETFTVNTSTTKTGTIEPGSKVSVHYTTDGGNMVATAISASPAKKAGTKAPKAPKK